MMSGGAVMSMAALKSINRDGNGETAPATPVSAVLASGRSA
jgi:hypothetical protein